MASVMKRYGPESESYQRVTRTTEITKDIKDIHFIIVVVHLISQIKIQTCNVNSMSVMTAKRSADYSCGDAVSHSC